MNQCIDCGVCAEGLLGYVDEERDETVYICEECYYHRNEVADRFLRDTDDEREDTYDLDWLT